MLRAVIAVLAACLTFSTFCAEDADPTPAVGADAPIIDVQPPSTPTAVLRGYSNDPTEVRVVTINSAPNAKATATVEGADTSYRVKPGYDEVTGLGTPNIPAFVKALAEK